MGVCVDIGSGGFLGLVSAPHVAESAIVTSYLPVCLDEAWFGGICAIDDSGRKIRPFDARTVFVVIAFLDCFQRLLVVYVGLLREEGYFCSDFFDGRITYMDHELGFNGIFSRLIAIDKNCKALPNRSFIDLQPHFGDLLVVGVFVWRQSISRPYNNSTPVTSFITDRLRDVAPRSGIQIACSICDMELQDSLTESLERERTRPAC